MTRIVRRAVLPRQMQGLIDSGLHPLLARVYAARGVRRRSELDYGLKGLIPPDALTGSAAAAAARVMHWTCGLRRPALWHAIMCRKARGRPCP